MNSNNSSGCKIDYVGVINKSQPYTDCRDNMDCYASISCAAITDFNKLTVDNFNVMINSGYIRYDGDGSGSGYGNCSFKKQYDPATGTLTVIISAYKSGAREFSAAINATVYCLH